MGSSQANGSRRLVDDLAAQIKKRILDGTYGPGERLRQDAVAREFDVSRTPLREALRMLEKAGFVILRPGRGAQVVSGDIDTLIDAYRVREVIDGLAARTVARDHKPVEAFDHLNDIIQRQKRTLDPWQPDAYAPLNLEFHESILIMSDNEYLTRQASVLHMTANVFVPHRILDVDRVRRAVEEHQGILEALRSGDPVTAENAARRHIRTTTRMLEQARRRSITAPPTSGDSAVDTANLEVVAL